MKRRRLLLQILLIVIVTFVCYINTFNVPFIYDDKIDIVDNPLIKNPSLLLTVEQFNQSRYIGLLSFALNYQIGGLNVMGYHIVNLLIHIINGILVYMLVLIIFRTPRMEGSKGLAEWVALGSGLLFVVHPVQTQAVTYIVQRYASMATMFYLLAVVSYGKWRSGGRGWWYVVGLVSAVLGMKTKEITFTLPIAMLLYEVVFYGRPDRKRLINLIPFFLTMAIIPLSKLNVGQTSGDITQKLSVATRAQTVLPRSDYFFTEMRVIVTYLRLLLLPYGLKLLYDYPVYSSLISIPVLLSLILHIALLSVAVIGLILARKSNSVSYMSAVSFGVLWFYLTLSVESSIIPIADVIFEHRIYLPSVGFFIAVSTVIVRMVFKLSERKGKYPIWATKVGFSMLVIVLAFLTYSRNNVWADELLFWKLTVKANPRHPAALDNLAEVYLRKGEYEMAKAYFEKAINLCPEYPVSYDGLGRLYLKTGQYKKAIQVLKKVMYMAPGSVDLLNNLGIAFLKTGDLQSALKYFKKTTTVDPMYYRGYYNTAMVYLKLNNPMAAVEQIKKALKINPGYTDAYLNLGIAYAMLKDFENAKLSFEEAIRLSPDDIRGYNNLGYLYLRYRRYQKAIEILNTALKIDPENKKAHYNLALCYKALNMKEKAIEHLRKAGINGA